MAREYREGAHTIYDIKMHLVWVTKYRHKVLRGEIGLRMRDLVRQVCASREIKILKGHVGADHVHLMVSMPPSLSVSRAVQYLKGRSSHKLLSEFGTLRKRYCRQHRWARGYWVASSGNVTDEMRSVPNTSRTKPRQSRTTTST